LAFTLAEGLATAVKTYVEANLTAKLTALKAEYNDGLALDATVKTFVGVKSLKSIPAGDYPALYIFAPSQRFHPMQVVPGTTQAVGDSMPELAVGIIAQEQDSEKLQVQLYRYSRALVELLLQGMAATADPLASWILSTEEPWEIDTITARFSESEDSPFVGEATLVVRGFKTEQRA
jgi:hypothetical protein